ncbi:MAG: glycosyltransferase family 39 protein [Chloroflexi bacterium]|nr:glycosyltransferase family 39 protein [Chloroflexota bacterium]
MVTHNIRDLTVRSLPIVLLIGVIARLGVLIAFPQVFAFSEPGADIHGSVAYDEYAINLLETGVYGRVPGVADAGLPPLYSYVLSLIYRFFGRNYIAVAAAHILFDALSIALLFDICRRLFPRDLALGERIGALAGLFFALYPYLIFQNLTLNDTALWILLLHLFVGLLLRLREREVLDRRTLLLAAQAGVVLGIASLARALLPALALLAVFWFLLKLSWRQTLLRLLPVALIGLLALLPWLMRSERVYGDFVPIALNSGENIYQGNNPHSAAVFRAGYDVQWLPPPTDALPLQEPVRRNEFLAEAGWRYLRENPAAIPDLLWVKFLIYWNPQVTPLRNLRQGEKLTVDADGAIIIVSGEGSHIGVTAANAAYQDDGLFNVVGRRVHVLYFGGLLLLAIAGAWLSRREWRLLSLLLIVQLSQTLMYLLFHPSTRYRSPTDPLLFVFSAYAVVWVAGWWRGRRSNAPG